MKCTFILQSSSRFCECVCVCVLFFSSFLDHNSVLMFTACERTHFNFDTLKTFPHTSVSCIRWRLYQKRPSFFYLLLLQYFRFIHFDQSMRGQQRKTKNVSVNINNIAICVEKSLQNIYIFSFTRQTLPSRLSFNLLSVWRFFFSSAFYFLGFRVVLDFNARANFQERKKNCTLITSMPYTLSEWALRWRAIIIFFFSIGTCISGFWFKMRLALIFLFLVIVFLNEIKTRIKKLERFLSW